MDQKLTVLVAEDERVNRRILRKILEPSYTVVEAENGAVAWKILKNRETRREIDAVLTDLNMPEMDGYALMEKIRAAGMGELPVLVLTGDSDPATEQHALEAGAWDFVSKPYNARILLSRLRNAVARRQVSVYMRMQKMAAHDPLTGLHNRARMFELTQRLIETHPEVRFVFVRADIDHFSLYNTAFGEEAGNRLLCYVAQQFRAIAVQYAPLCAFGRMTADVFCACAPYSGNADAVESLVVQVQKKLAEYQKNYRLEISVGVDVIEDRSLGAEEYYVRATMAAQKCKSQYSTHVGFYDESMRRHAAEEISIASEMERALAERQFVLYFQPKVALALGQASGAEVLVRWLHPARGLISPGVFIPLFERNGFIARLDRYVWEETCRTLRAWLEQGVMPMPVSVNISRISLYDPQLVDELVELVHKYQIDVKLFQLEITESAYMSSPELMQKTIHDLHASGFTILMDDFGSGYSSLNTLKDIDVDILKIDMKFLPVGHNVEKGEIILASMIKMANWLGMPVVVEGVETQKQRDFLESMGSDYIQGYFYSRPLPQKEYEENYVLRQMVFEEKRPVVSEKGKQQHRKTILVIDDSELDRRLLSEYLEDRYQVHTCASAEEGLLYLKRNQMRVRLILVDNVMPDMSGIDFLNYCKDHESLCSIPQIMVTANDSVDAQVTAFRCGVYDYIAKPLRREIVVARVNHIMEVSRLYRAFENTEYGYRSSAQRDAFTGLLNKNAFNELSSRYFESYPDDRMALLLFDLDGFKEVNDRYGHQVGDRVIKTVAGVLQSAFRKADLIGRFGGDEFTVLMSNLPCQEIARRKSAELIKAIAIACAREEHVNIGVSIGVSFREENDTLETMFARSDAALYEGKNAGKGLVVVYGEKVPPILNDDKPLVLICGEDPQLYPAIALSYGDAAAFANVCGFDALRETFDKYAPRIRAICLDMQKKQLADSDAFYQYILAQGGGTRIPLIAVCREGDIAHLRMAMQLDIQDVISIPPQMDAIQRKLSRAIFAGCVE